VGGSIEAFDSKIDGLEKHEIYARVKRFHALIQALGTQLRESAKQPEQHEHTVNNERCTHELSS
jgi:hypothetical protein